MDEVDLRDCPCGLLLSYEQCCQPLHNGQTAVNPEALMRSRYSAFVLNDAEYLLKSWHPSTRPETLELDQGSCWLKLSVLSSEHQPHSGKVHFKAYLKEENEFYELEEKSNFKFEHGHWFYVDGISSFNKIKPHRNDQCPCNSGKKFKKCCKQKPC